MSKMVKGYKVFNSDWTCRGFQYEVGKTYTLEGKPEICVNGFHFCENLVDCFNYYKFDPNNKVAEIRAYNTILNNGKDKSCTNKIKIMKELSWAEVLRMVNSGDFNSGYFNSGDFNSGDFNSINNSSGCFNTEETTIRFFNKESNWTYKDWEMSNARRLLLDMPQSEFVWIDYTRMTDEEKTAHPEAEVTVGYLKKMDSDVQKWWNELAENDKNEIKAIPNFDADIFRQCTGIGINK